LTRSRGAELFLGRTARGRCAALRENGTTVEQYVEPATPGRFGRIARARVVRVMPGIQSAILDTGLGCHALLAASDLSLPGETEQARAAPIEDRLREGRDLLVQIARESNVESRGDRATTDVRVAGRRLVLLPLRRAVKVSRRIIDADERERLLAWIGARSEPGCGWIVRTPAAGATERELAEQADRLLGRFREIRARVDAGGSPGPVDDPPDFVTQLVRNAPAGLARLVVDGVEEHERTVERLRAEAPELAPVVELHRGPPGVVDAYGLAGGFRSALDPRVPLPSGGSLVIETTAALITVDVNTGSADGADAMTRTNLEAARELARQLRLRDMGGSIVVDFAGARCGERVLAALHDALRADPARTRVAGVTELGLVHLTRDARLGPTWLRWTRPCDDCRGRGRVPRDDFPFG